MSRPEHLGVRVAVLAGTILGLVWAVACEDDASVCDTADNAADCEATTVSEGRECGWVTIRRMSADACEVEETREACVEFAGTEAGCAPCGETDEVAFVWPDDDAELLTTLVCGPRPDGWELCENAPGSPACACAGC
jgi:hypothetical protein